MKSNVAKVVELSGKIMEPYVVKTRALIDNCI